jgi:hypothetical protein
MVEGVMKTGKVGDSSPAGVNRLGGGRSRQRARAQMGYPVIVIAEASAGRDTGNVRS